MTNKCPLRIKCSTHKSGSDYSKSALRISTMHSFDWLFPLNHPREVGFILRQHFRNQLVFFRQFSFGHVDARSGAFEKLLILAVSKTCVTDILLWDDAFEDSLVTSVTDIGSLIQTAAALLNEVPAGLIAGWTGSAFHITKDNLTADIGFPAMVAVNAEFVRIIEGTLMIPVA